MSMRRLRGSGTTPGVARMALPVIVLGLLASLPQTAGAQSAPRPPRPVTQPSPPAPVRAGTEIEGWSVVRYSVRPDGTVDNVRIVDAVPPGIDTEPTLAAVRTWTFSPATHDGAAIDWHNAESVVVYRSPAARAEPSRNFEAGYQAIRDLLEGEPPIDLQAALDMNRRLLAESAAGIGEIGLALAQRTIIAFGMEDWNEAYETIRLATDPRVPALAGEDLLVGLQLRLRLANTLGHIEDALETHGRIAAGLGPDQEDPFATMAEALSDRLAGEEALQVAGRIGEAPWRISPSRRIFTLAGIEGAVDALDIECDRRRMKLEYQPEVEWQLPDSWGECELFVSGEPGTTFLFLEFRAPAAPAE